MKHTEGDLETSDVKVFCKNQEVFNCLNIDMNYSQKITNINRLVLCWNNHDRLINIVERQNRLLKSVIEAIRLEQDVEYPEIIEETETLLKELS